MNRNTKPIQPHEQAVMVDILRQACGDQIPWYYDLFAAFNELFFDKELPTPLITSEILPYGKCLGATHPLGVPRVQMHIALCDDCGNFSATAWNGSVDRTTATFVFLHELVHISQRRPHLIDLSGTTSHNARNWVIEANRMSEAIDLPRACRRWVSVRTKQGTGKGPDMKEPTATPELLQGLTMQHVATWPYGIARLVYPRKVPAWGESVIRKLNLPTFKSSMGKSP
jgi:hypothetical protein